MKQIAFCILGLNTFEVLGYDVSFDNDGKTRRNSGRNGSEFYWWPSPTFKEKRRLQMNKFRFTLMAFAIMAFTLMISSGAQAQATRTWVSGVGDDVNPCSRTAPCKTFAGAFSKTAVDGEIDCLDPGGFGSVTLTKSITLDGGATGEGSILASGTQAILVNVGTAGVTSAVQIRNISMNGGGTGTFGVRVLNGTTTGITVEVENCVIFGFKAAGAGIGRGISDERTVSGGLWVQNTLVKNNSGSGVVIIGAGAGTAQLDNVQAVNNGSSGIVTSGSGRIMTARNCVAYRNTGAGFVSELSSKMDVINSATTFNAQGIESDSSAEIRVSRTTVTRNTANGLVLGGGTILSYGTNEVSANAGTEAFTVGGPLLK